MTTRLTVRLRLSTLLILGAVLSGQVRADTGNIDPANKFAWAENAGWVNFAPTHGGVTVHPEGYVSGFAWAENIGWIKLSCDAAGPYANDAASNWGVNLKAGMLSGFAWSENAGWINFHPTHDQVTIDRETGRFAGYAWSESVGWIHFQASVAPSLPGYYNVRTSASLRRGVVLSLQ